MLENNSFFYEVYHEDYKTVMHEMSVLKRSMDWMLQEMDKLSYDDKQEFKDEVRRNSIKLKARLDEINKTMVEIRQKD